MKLWRKKRVNKQFTSQLSQKQKKFSAICVGSSFLLCGIFLLFVATDIINLRIKDILLATILVGVGLAMLLSSFVQDNRLFMWIGLVIIVCGIATYFCELSVNGYTGWYFLYLFAPAVASIFTMLVSREYRFHIKIIILFMLVGIFAIMSMYIDKAVVLSCGIITLSVAIIASAFFKENKR